MRYRVQSETRSGVSKTGPITAALLALIFAASFAPMQAFAGGQRTFTELLPLSPLPADATADGHAHAVVETEPGKRERLKLEVEDVMVIEDLADPHFCTGFYEVVVKDAAGTEISISSPRRFPGVIIRCDIAGNPAGPNQGSTNLEFRVDKGDTFFGFSGKTIQIWMVRVVRDPATGVAVEGPNGEPFMIAERLVVALEGVLN